MGSDKANLTKPRWLIPAVFALLLVGVVIAAVVLLRRPITGTVTHSSGLIENVSVPKRLALKVDSAEWVTGHGNLTFKLDDRRPLHIVVTCMTYENFPQASKNVIERMKWLVQNTNCVSVPFDDARWQIVHVPAGNPRWHILMHEGSWFVYVMAHPPFTEEDLKETLRSIKLRPCDASANP